MTNILSPYHAQLNEQANNYRRAAYRLASGILSQLATMSPDQQREITEEMHRNRLAADHIEAQIAWERWFAGAPQVWRPAEPAWRN